MLWFPHHKRGMNRSLYLLELSSIMCIGLCSLGASVPWHYVNVTKTVFVERECSGGSREQAQSAKCLLYKREDPRETQVHPGEKPEAELL